MERESSGLSPLKGGERAIVCQTNIGTVLKATLSKFPIDGVIMGFSERTDTILK